MAQTIAEERVPARMPTAVYEKISAAAQAVGATLNQFLVQSALERADSILEQEQIIKLSAAASEELFRIMENPPEANEYLINAMQRRKDTLCQK
jgi:uncharacterized protein (DUF1778 family)